MATRQRTRARNRTNQNQTEAVQTGIVSKTTVKINQAQSVELAKTFLHSSIGSIAYLRDLFPVDCYGETRYSTEKGVIPYNDFVKGTEQHAVGTRPSFGQTFRVVMRNRSAKVDAFLDTLENGIFFALESGHLEALDLLIVQRPQTPLQVLEKYTYYFHHGAEGISAITPPGPDKTPISLETIKQDMRSVIKRIIELDRVLPRLPEDRFLTMQLHYTEDAPIDFESPGFLPASQTVLRIENDRGWHMEDTDFGNFKTNDHNISLVGSILENTHSELSVPADLEFVEVPNIIPFPMISKNPRIMASIEEQERNPVARVLNSHNIFTAQDPTHNENENESLPLPPNEELARQQLQGMRLSQVLNEGRVDTQRITQDTSQTSYKFLQRFPDRQPLRIAAPMLRKLTAGGREKVNGHSSSKQDGVSCQCDWNHDEESMIQCHFCGDWQHIYCLGYISSEDSSIPEVYACTKCLLDIAGPQAEEDMRFLALVRNGIQIILSTGFTSDEEFRAALHCDMANAKRVIDVLISEEILNHNHKKSHRLKGRNYCVRSRMPKLERVLNNYFDPARGIKFLFENNGDRNHGSPAPDTNTSYRATSNVMFASPMEDLDLNSAAVQTPRALRSSKRHLRDNDHDETRHAKRYRVSESLTMINVAMRST